MHTFFINFQRCSNRTIALSL